MRLGFAARWLLGGALAALAVIHSAERRWWSLAIDIVLFVGCGGSAWYVAVDHERLTGWTRKDS